MKNIKLVLFALMSLVLFASDALAQQDRNRNSDYVALYRLYNSETSDHLYTTDCNEKDEALNNDYVDEGITGYVAKRQVRGAIPLYRLLHGSGEHFYTIDSREKNNLIRRGDAEDEGIVGYVSSSQQRGTVPLYRLYDGTYHLYTTDEREKNGYLRRNSNSRLENISGYVWTSGSNSCDSENTSDYDNYPIIYSRADFRGKSQTLENDWNVDADWDGSPNTIRAIRVPRGWYVTIYERRNFRGKSFLMSNDAVFTTDNEWYNRIGSIKVSKGTPPR